MEIQSMIQLWLVSCWLAAIFFVIGWTVWGVNMTVTNQQVLQAAVTMRTAIQKAERAEHKIDLLVMTVNAKPESDKSDVKIDPSILAEMRNMWMLIEKESKKLGITPQEFMLRVSELLEEKK